MFDGNLLDDSEEIENLAHLMGIIMPDILEFLSRSEVSHAPSQEGVLLIHPEQDAECHQGDYRFVIHIVGESAAGASYGSRQPLLRRIKVELAIW